MPVKKLQGADDEVLSIEILVNGQRLQDQYMPTFIEIDRNMNKIGTAKISFWLPIGGGDNDTFEMSESSDMVPGNKIEIKLGNVNDINTAFSGTIVNIGIKNIDNATNELVLQCSDNAVKMTMGCRSAYYQEQQDNAIISAVIGKHSLTAKVDSTTYTHPQIVQYQANDWDFIRTRAEANGLLVYTDNDTVFVQKPICSGASVLKIDFGKDVFSYDLSLEARQQETTVSCKAWDLKTQTIVESKSTEPSNSTPGNIKTKDLGGKIGFAATELATTAPLDKNELNAWANANLLMSRLNAIQGNITIQGSTLPKLNTIVTLSGFGQRFNGDEMVTSLRHYLRDGNWETTVGFGLPVAWTAAQPSVSAPAASGLLPAIHGLQNGTVKKIDADPDGQYRIQVNMPIIEPTGTGIWARMAQFYATNGKGSFFLPEVGDEVILGFLNEDPRFPVILGMLYSSKLKAPYTPDNENSIKAIVTKNDLTIEMNDKDKVLTIKTPGKNIFTLSDKDNSIILADQNGNKIEMTSSGISLNSPKDINIKAMGAITLDAVGKIGVISSGGDIGLEGLNVNAKAKVAFSAQGGAAAELKANGQTTVKGAMVLIN
jgi:Rhs element Vgr protein